ncbi:MAG: AAA family ATPase [Verrucomicrobiales bacterium]
MAIQLDLFPTPEPPLGGGFLSAVMLKRDEVPNWDVYPFNIPAVRNLTTLPLHRAVTFLIGENGSGKSTLLEAMAVRLGFPGEGGSRNYSFATRDTHSGLSEYLRTVRDGMEPTGRESDGFFLRAESFYPLMTQVEAYENEAPTPYGEWGGRSPHERSHGEAFLTLLTQRLRGHGLYLFDEPEAALSAQRQLAVLTHLHALVKNRSQLVIATHSPILLAYPNAVIYQCDEDGLHPVAYEESDAYRLTREFLRGPERMMERLFAEEPP